MLQLTGALRAAAKQCAGPAVPALRLASSTAQRPDGEQEPDAVGAAVPTSQYGEIGLVSGAPGDVYTRKVKIFVPVKNPEQSGLSKAIDGPGKGPLWRLEIDNRQKWENNLMGWTSTADSMDSVMRSHLQFQTKEDAIAFAKKNGWPYDVREPHYRRRERQKRFAGYGDNFSVRRGGYPTGGLASEHGYLPGSNSRPPREEADKRMGSGAPNKAGGTEMKQGTTS
ncbi:hypothetical protein WJX74_009181 [Apatococcus lobatus]|uniref:NADH dehydrogenase [ubiquinone] iron-sulfur protein 4, mitochondrial n=2 Tax=Apatococcus TaxID=904362 RepID=A0AAW1SVB2_9CHLO